MHKHQKIDLSNFDSNNDIQDTVNDFYAQCQIRINLKPVTVYQRVFVGSHIHVLLEWPRFAMYTTLAHHGRRQRFEARE
jgi:hypothetical protein